MPSYKAPGVYVEELDRGAKSLSAAGTAVAAFVGFTERGPLKDDQEVGDEKGERPRKITSWIEFLRLYGGFAPDAYLPQAVNGFFNNGGTTCYIVRIPHLVELEGDAARPAAEAHLEFDEQTLDEAVHMILSDEKLNAAAVRFDQGVTKDESPQTYVVKTLTSEGTVAKSEPPLTAEDLREKSIGGVDVKFPEKFPPGATVPSRTYKLLPPRDVREDLAPKDFVGDAETRTGLKGLDGLEDVTMVLVPDAVRLVKKPEPGKSPDFDPLTTVQNEVITHCERHKDRMAILDPPMEVQRPSEVLAWRKETARFDSKFATLYYPWVQIGGDDGRVSLPPCGHVAGIWARTDNDIGVWKAPANATINGVLGVDHETTRVQQEDLNPEGINAIRSFGSEGLRVWGARTLSSDSSWNYINVRRLFNMVEKTIKDGTNWVVFEPNDPTTWGRVWGTLDGFLRGLWRQGAFFGATPGEAYYIKVDRETNPQDVIDRGELVVEVGFAPVKPAEFVIFRVSQFQSQSS